MSPRREHAKYRPAELMLTRFANTLLVMNKAKLQTQTGAGRIVTLTMNIQCRKSAVDFRSLLICCKLAPYVLSLLLHMNESKQKERESENAREKEKGVGGGWRRECRWFLCGAVAGGVQNAACHSDVRHVFSQWGSRDNAGDSWWRGQLVVPPQPPPARWRTAPKSEWQMWGGNKSPSLNNRNSAARRPEWANKRCGNLAGASDNRVPTPLSSISLALLEASPILASRAPGVLQLNHVTFALPHFFQAEFEYEKGPSLSPSKNVTLMTFGSHLIYWVLEEGEKKSTKYFICHANPCNIASWSRVPGAAKTGGTRISCSQKAANACESAE